MKILRPTDKKFKATLDEILSRDEASSAGVDAIVDEIIATVKERGDRALSEYTLKFDGVDLKGKLRVSEAEITSAVKKISKKDLALLELSAERIKDFHEKQLQKSWHETDASGITLGQLVNPLERVGIYVPGGKAVYPSSVLMNAIPARVAGVKEIVMVTPPLKNGTINPYVLAAARVAGVKKVFRIGGAQAIAALACGTKSVPKVDKIVGPGNIFVAMAKKKVFGTVDIDMIAGPSEILIVADRFADPAFIAADLLSQAEHDELASSILVTPSCTLASKVKKEVALQLKKLKRTAIAESSIKNFGVIFKTKDMAEAIKLSNRIAPEHLELCVKEPMELLKKIKNAGAVFLGANTPEAVGDYMAGPNHTLPTGGTARFSSPLGVYDFIKFTSIIGFSEDAINKLGPKIERFANIEGLEGHAKSITKRLKKK